MEKKLPEISEWKKTRKSPRNINIEHREKLSLLERFAVKITEWVGSMHFFILVLIWTASWFGWNIFAPVDLRFDPFPAFVLWLFISNAIQLFILPLVMVGQNLQSRHSEARALEDFEVNKTAEKDIGIILSYLEEVNKLLKETLSKNNSDKV